MIIADCHEPDEIINGLKKSIPLKVANLSCGDYISSNTVIERKTLSDFFLSIKSGRLSEQMEKMRLNYSRKYLIIEGVFDFTYVKNISWLYRQLSDYALNYNAVVLFSKDKEDSVYLIKRIYFSICFGIKTKGRDKKYYAAKFLGISRKKAEILFSSFKNMKEIANSSKKDIMGLKGIGRKTAEKISSVLEKEP